MDFNFSHLADHPMVVGATGSLTGLLFSPRRTPLELVAVFVGGAFSGYYVGRGLFQHLHMQGEHLLTGTIFLVALLSMHVVEAGLNAWHQLPLAEILKGVLGRFFKWS